MARDIAIGWRQEVGRQSGQRALAGIGGLDFALQCAKPYKLATLWDWPTITVTSVEAQNKFGSGSRMNPVFRIGDVEVVLNLLQVVSVATDQLGALVDSLADHGQQVTDAMDELMTRAWG